MFDKKRKPKDAGDLSFDIISAVILILALLVTFYPFIWMILNAFRTTAEIFQRPFNLPAHYDFHIFIQAWNQANYTTAFRNSIIVTLFVVLISIVFGSLAAFAIARLKFPGRNLLNRLLSQSMVISGQLILVPLFMIILQLNIYDTLFAAILATSALTMPFVITYLHSFFKSIPLEIEESTVIDGCPKRIFYLRFMLPLSKPALASLCIFQSLNSWNEYLYALTFLKTASIRTIPLQMSSFFALYRIDWQALFAALTMAVIPLLILYLFSQKYFIRGLTAGAVKQ